MLQKAGWETGEGLGADGQGITAPVNRGATTANNLGVGVTKPNDVVKEDDEIEQYRKRMMLAYKYRPNPLNNPRRAYY
jgi:splicing factor 4